MSRFALHSATLVAFLASPVLSLSSVPLMGQPIGPQAMAIGGPFRLVDQDGRTFTDQNLKGRPSLIFFGFSHCPDRTTLFDISELLRQLGPDADRVAALFITLDPERDTPDKLKDYLSSFDPHLRGLTGDPASIDAVARAYHVYFEKLELEGGGYTIDHSTFVYLMNRDGRFVALFSLKRTPEAAAAELRRHF